MTYPKEIGANLRYRGDILTACERDDSLAGVVRTLFQKDILYAFNVWFWVYEVRSKEKSLPFVTWAFQDEYILSLNEAIETGENVFTDKSRDMGVTYMVLYVMLWRWMTKKGEDFRIGSRKEEYVDKSGDMDSLFEKMRYNLKRIPLFLQPQGFDLRKHSTYMKFLNPEFGNSIVGEATNRDFARGGRKKAVFFDEFQAWEMATEAWRSASDATRCKIAVGTPQGSGNKFAELSRTTEIKVKHHLLWMKHPLKAVTSPEYAEKIKDQLHADQSVAPLGCFVDKGGKIRSEWYDNECTRRTSEDVAENLDCNYLTTGRPVFDTELCNLKMLQAKEPVKVGDLYWKVRPLYDDYGTCTNRGEVEAGFSENRNGLLKLWKEPEVGWENGYCISADVAEGLAQGDYSSATVLKRFADDFTPEIVATIHCKLRSEEYAQELWKLAVWYGRCYVAPERTGLGLSVVNQLAESYDRIYFKEVMTKGEPRTTDKLGWDTTSHSKPIIVSNLSRMISENSFIDPDEFFWKETLTFVNDDGSLEAQGKSRGDKCYDDRVMDRAILLWIHGQLPAPRPKRVKEKLEGWRKAEWGRKNEGKLVGWVIH